MDLLENWKLLQWRILWWIFRHDHIFFDRNYTLQMNSVPNKYVFHQYVRFWQFTGWSVLRIPILSDLKANIYNWKTLREHFDWKRGAFLSNYDQNENRGAKRNVVDSKIVLYCRFLHTTPPTYKTYSHLSSFCTINSQFVYQRHHFSNSRKFSIIARAYITLPICENQQNRIFRTKYWSLV